MRITYYSKTDILYIQFSEINSIERTYKERDYLYPVDINYNSKGLAGIKIYNFSQILPLKSLKQIKIIQINNSSSLFKFKPKGMEFVYYKPEDTLDFYFINLQNYKRTYQETAGDDPIYLDFNKEGKIIGIEILDVSNHFNLKTLHKLDINVKDA